MKSFPNEILNFFLQKALFLSHFGSCQNSMSSANLAPENHLKLCNKRVLSTEIHVLVNMLLCSTHHSMSKVNAMEQMKKCIK